MVDAKQLLCHLSRICLEAFVLCAFVVHGQGECSVRCPRHPTLIVQNVQNPRSFEADKIQHVLIFREFDEAPRNLFSVVFLLLVAKDKEIELLLQCLVTIVDAQLFEGIDLERLEAKDILRCTACVKIRRELS